MNGVSSQQRDAQDQANRLAARIIADRALLASTIDSRKQASSADMATGGSGTSISGSRDVSPMASGKAMGGGHARRYSDSGSSTGKPNEAAISAVEMANAAIDAARRARGNPSAQPPNIPQGGTPLKVYPGAGIRMPPSRILTPRKSGEVRPNASPTSVSSPRALFPTPSGGVSSAFPPVLRPSTGRHPTPPQRISSFEVPAANRVGDSGANGASRHPSRQRSSSFSGSTGSDLDLRHNDNAFHVVATLLTSRLESKGSLDESDRTYFEKTLPSSVRQSFVDALRHRVSQLPPKAGRESPLVSLTRVCQGMGLDRNDATNILLPLDAISAEPTAKTGGVYYPPGTYPPSSAPVPAAVTVPVAPKKLFQAEDFDPIMAGRPVSPDAVEPYDPATIAAAAAAAAAPTPVRSTSRSRGRSPEQYRMMAAAPPTPDRSTARGRSPEQYNPAALAAAAVVSVPTPPRSPRTGSRGRSREQRSSSRGRSDSSEARARLREQRQQLELMERDFDDRRKRLAAQEHELQKRQLEQQREQIRQQELVIAEMNRQKEQREALKLEEEKKAAAEKLELERVREMLRREKEQVEELQREKEQIEKEKEEAEKQRKLQLQKEAEEQEKKLKERMVKEQKEQERLKQEQQRKKRELMEKAERERKEKARLQNEREAKEKAESERKAKELQMEREIREKIEREQAEKDLLEKEKAEKERLEKDLLEKEKAEKERLERERLETERLEKERQERVRLEQTAQQAKEREEQARLELESAKRHAQEQRRTKVTSRQDPLAGTYVSPSVPAPSPISAPMQVQKSGSSLMQESPPAEVATSGLSRSDDKSREQIQLELNEASALLASSTSTEATRFWQEHIRELQTRLRVLDNALAAPNGSAITHLLDDASSTSPAARGLGPDAARLLAGKTSLASSTSANAPLLDKGQMLLEMASIPHSSDQFHSQTPQRKEPARAVDPSAHSRTPQSSTGPPTPSSIQQQIVSTHRSNQGVPIAKPTPYVDVLAPSDLPEGYSFEAKMGRKRFIATVPAGGVRKGQKFTCPMKEIERVEIMVPMGGWKDGVFDCMTNGLAHPLFLNGLFLPHIALGQIMTRNRLTWLGYPGTRVHSKAACMNMSVVLLLWVSLDCLCAFSMWVKLHRGYLPSVVDLGVFAAINLFMVLFLMYAIRNTRHSIRTKYEIPDESYVGIEDAVCAAVCGPCTICQMGRHTADFESYNGVCLNSTGLPNKVELAFPSLSPNSQPPSRSQEDKDSSYGYVPAAHGQHIV